MHYLLRIVKTSKYTYLDLDPDRLVEESQDVVPAVEVLRLQEGSGIVLQEVLVAM